MRFGEFFLDLPVNLAAAIALLNRVPYVPRGMTVLARWLTEAPAEDCGKVVLIQEAVNLGNILEGLADGDRQAFCSFKNLVAFNH